MQNTDLGGKVWNLERLKWLTCRNKTEDFLYVIKQYNLKTPCSIGIRMERGGDMWHGGEKEKLTVFCWRILKKWDHDIKVDLKEIELEGVDQIKAARLRDNMAGFLNEKIKFRVYIMFSFG